MDTVDMAAMHGTRLETGHWPMKKTLAAERQPSSVPHVGNAGHHFEDENDDERRYILRTRMDDINMERNTHSRSLARPRTH